MKLIKGMTDYLITLDGRVFSLYSMQFLKNFVKNDYVYVKIKDKSHRVHRLVALTYLPNPENKATVNHIDGVKTNNMLFNLEWATQSENVQHACDTGLTPVTDLMRENGRKMKCNLIMGYNPAVVKLVLNEETGIYYEGVKEAGETIGLTQRQMWKRLSGELKNTTKFKYV